MKTAAELRREADALHARANSLNMAADRLDRKAYEEMRKKMEEAAAKIPVDRNARTLTDGSPVTADHRELKPNGQQKDYVVLSAEERAKGFVRPVRLSYKHQVCGGVTTMGQSIAETYARDPGGFYSGTFCCHCGDHFPIGEAGKFVWLDDGSKVGT